MTRVIHIDDLIHPVDKSPLFACQYLSLILLVTMLHPNIHSKDTHHFPFTLNSLIFNTIHIQWKEIYYPLRFGKTWWDSTEGVNIWSYQREKRKNHENCKTLFTLHQSIITIWYSEVLIGWRVSIHSSPLFTPSSPYLFFPFLLHPSEDFRRVKSREEWAGTLHLPKSQCLSGFQAKRWRVKSKKEIRILYDASEESLIRQFLQYERTHRFLPRLGIILPCTRAISCQGEVKYEKRTEALLRMW